MNSCAQSLARQQVIQFADMIGASRSAEFKYNNIYHLVACLGQEHTPQPLPEGVRIGKKKFCFMNAYQLAEMRDDLIYVEGYAVAKGLPIAFIHAWCIDRDNNVIDPTWGEGDSYFGIPLDLNYVRRIILARGMYGVLDNMEQGFPALRGEISVRRTEDE